MKLLGLASRSFVTAAALLLVALVPALMVNVVAGPIVAEHGTRLELMQS